MPDQLQHAMELLAHGLLTELPTQLVSAAVVATAAATARAWRRRGAQKRTENPDR